MLSPFDCLMRPLKTKDLRVFVTQTANPLRLSSHTKIGFWGSSQESLLMSLAVNTGTAPPFSLHVINGLVVLTAVG